MDRVRGYVKFWRCGGFAKRGGRATALQKGLRAGEGIWLGGGTPAVVAVFATGRSPTRPNWGLGFSGGAGERRERRINFYAIGQAEEIHLSRCGATVVKVDSRVCRRKIRRF